MEKEDKNAERDLEIILRTHSEHTSLRSYRSIHNSIVDGRNY